MNNNFANHTNSKYGVKLIDGDVINKKPFSDSKGAKKNWNKISNDIDNKKAIKRPESNSFITNDDNLKKNSNRISTSFSNVKPSIILTKIDSLGLFLNCF